jgi:ribosomal protein L23
VKITATLDKSEIKEAIAEKYNTGVNDISLMITLDNDIKAIVDNVSITDKPREELDTVKQNVKEAIDTITDEIASDIYSQTYAAGMFRALSILCDKLGLEVIETVLDVIEENENHDRCRKCSNHCNAESDN